MSNEMNKFVLVPSSQQRQEQAGNAQHQNEGVGTRSKSNAQQAAAATRGSATVNYMRERGAIGAANSTAIDSSPIRVVGHEGRQSGAEQRHGK